LSFRDRPGAFRTDERKILFILSYLKGAAISWFEPGLMDPTNSAHWMWNYAAFISELETNFGPHDPAGDAEKALSTLTMKDNQRILRYNVEFWKLASHVSWNDAAIASRYYLGLPTRLRMEVLRGGKPTTLAEIRYKAQDADDIYWAMKDEAAQEIKAATGTSKPPTTSKGSGNRPATSSKQSSAPPPGKPNPLANKLDNSGKLTVTERDRRIKEKLCLYCGLPGHIRANCPKATAASARAVTAEQKSTSDSKN
jgi:hypothetical protein